MRVNKKSLVARSSDLEELGAVLLNLEQIQGQEGKISESYFFHLQISGKTNQNQVGRVYRECKCSILKERD